MNNQTHNCQKCQEEFIISPNEISFYEKMGVPTPLVCPDCRFKMRAMFRNETTLYSGRHCDMCGKSIISMYNPKSPYVVYCYNCFYSEKWDAQDYAVDYDESRPFLEQFKEFIVRVPKITTYLSLGNGLNINSEYCNGASGCKNSYLVFSTSFAEEVMYSRGVIHTKDSSDMYFGSNFERCYESINVQESSGILFSQNVVGSVDSAFIHNGRGLMNCFGCVNLNNKSHYFLNQPLPKEEYDMKVAEIMGSYSKIEALKREFEEFKKNFPMRENNNIKTVNSSGDYLFECKDVQGSFEVTNSENSFYLFSAKHTKDSMGVIGYGIKSELLLESVATGYSNNIIGSYGAENSSDILYGFYVRNCQKCIACDALHNGKYSIFNKEYSEEEYERLRNIIISELKADNLYGLMMPASLSPFSYNETIAQNHFPLIKEEAVHQGFNWQDDLQKTEGKETLSPEQIPDNIKDTPDTILGEILRCVSCSRNYKITPQELQFYKKMNIPVSRNCFNCRHQARIVRRGPYKFWDRRCAKCNKNIKTNYPPESPYTVYCESCYQQEVY